MIKPSRITIDLSARCLCGAVEMSARGPVVSMLMCGCLDCQRSTGGGHSSLAIVPAPSLAVTGPYNSLVRPSDSGAQFTRCFCPGCGAPLFGQSSRATDWRMIVPGFFAGQNDWFAPSQLIFARSHPSWAVIADHLPRHQTYREGGTP